MFRFSNMPKHYKDNKREEIRIGLREMIDIINVCTNVISNLFDKSRSKYQASFHLAVRLINKGGCTWKALTTRVL